MSRNSKFSRRQRKRRKQNNTILIVCCGQTEEKYFRAFNLDLGEIKIKAVTRPKSPSQMVKIANNMKQDALYRDVWCVFDKDDFTDFDQSILLAESLNIRIAFSNQAFEYWFILHFERTSVRINRNRYSYILERHMGCPYEKASDNMYDSLKDKIGIAIENAKVIHQEYRRQGGTPSSWESSTTVYKLVDELEKWKK